MPMVNTRMKFWGFLTACRIVSFWSEIFDFQGYSFIRRTRETKNLIIIEIRCTFSYHVQEDDCKIIRVTIRLLQCLAKFKENLDKSEEFYRILILSNKIHFVCFK